MTVDHRIALAALDRAYGGVSDLAAGLTAPDLMVMRLGGVFPADSPGTDVLPICSTGTAGG